MDDLPEALQPVYDGIVELILRFERQYQRMMKDLNSSTLTRLGLIIAVYLTVRPFYVRFIEWTHKKGEEREERKKKEKKAAAKAKARMSANELRTGKPGEQVEIADSEDSDEEPAEISVSATGVVLNEDQLDRKARWRQRRIDRARADKEEMHRFEQEEWDNPDVSDLLVGRAE